MKKRREHSKNFSISENETSYTLLSQDKLPSKEDILRELEAIERYEASLATVKKSDIRKSYIKNYLIPKRQSPDVFASIIPTIEEDGKSEINKIISDNFIDIDELVDDSFESKIDTFLQGGKGRGKNVVTVLESEKEEKKEDIPSSRSTLSLLKSAKGFSLVAFILTVSLVAGFFAQRLIEVKDRSIKQSATAYENFVLAQQSLKDFNFNDATKDFNKAYESLVLAEDSLKSIGETTLAIVENIPFESRADSAISLLEAAKHMAKAGEILSSTFTLLPIENAMSANTFLEVLGGDSSESGYIVDILDKFFEEVSKAEVELIISAENLKNVRPHDFPVQFRESVSELGEKIPDLLGLVRVAKDYSRISNILLGGEKAQRYLILFQNSSELRPTGGFIGTYATIEVENGTLNEMIVEGIYQVDGQLVVNVVPPRPFWHITTGWSTHDANWFLDFPTSAQKTAWFFERTGEGKVDGVITLNIEVIERLLELTGPIELKDYDLLLDANNFRDEVQYEVEVAYDKKTNRPKKALSDFTPIFLEKLLEVSKEDGKEIFSILLNALEQKYIMAYFSDEQLENFFESQGWSGSIVEPKMENQESSSDYIAVVHSNIGGYKTDKFIEDFAKYNLEAKEEGSLIATIELERIHNGGNSDYWWYNRKNIDYVKIYVPLGSKIISSFGGLRREASGPDYEALGFVEDSLVATIEKEMESFGPVDIFEETGKTVFGTWLTTNPGDSSSLTIKYKLPARISFSNDVARYNLYWQKQPGTEISANVSLSIPDSWKYEWSNVSDGSASFLQEQELDMKQELILDIDKVIGYIFSR